jgi:hypothetical protein
MESVSALPAFSVDQEAVFIDVAQKAGIDFTHFNSMIGSLALPEIVGSSGALFDYDNDGDLDVFIVHGGVLDPRKKFTDTLSPWK